MTSYSLVNIAYGYFSKGEPFPLDLQMNLNAAGFDPDTLEEQFQDGQSPSEIINEEIEEETNNG